MTNTIYLSADIEADGPIPGPFSMLSFGVVAFDAQGREQRAFARNLELLPGAIQHPETMAWWAERPEAYARTRVNCVPPLDAMRDFDAWMRRELPGKLTFTGYPASYDFLFLYWYLMRFLGLRDWENFTSTGAVMSKGRDVLDYRSPFGFQALDVKSLAMIPMECDFRDVGKRKMPKAWFEGQPEHTHDPLDDARGQGMLLFKVLEAARLDRLTARSAEDRIAVLRGEFRERAERVQALEAAIRKHRDQRGDDRCWLDDGELYVTALGDTPMAACALPPREEFLANCARYHASRHPSGVPYVSEQREIERLRARVEELEHALAERGET